MKFQTLLVCLAACAILCLPSHTFAQCCGPAIQQWQQPAPIVYQTQSYPTNVYQAQSYPAYVNQAQAYSANVVQNAPMIQTAFSPMVASFPTMSDSSAANAMDASAFAARRTPVYQGTQYQGTQYQGTQYQGTQYQGTQYPLVPFPVQFGNDLSAGPSFWMGRCFEPCYSDCLRMGLSQAQCARICCDGYYWF